MCARCGGAGGYGCGACGGSPSGIRGGYLRLEPDDLEEYLADLKREVERVQGRLIQLRGQPQ